MTNTELKKILTQATKSKENLLKKLRKYQDKQDDAGCDIIYYQLGIVNDNIDFCLTRLEQV